MHVLQRRREDDPAGQPEFGSSAPPVLRTSKVVPSQPPADRPPPQPSDAPAPLEPLPGMLRPQSSANLPAARLSAYVPPPQPSAPLMPPQPPANLPPLKAPAHVGPLLPAGSSVEQPVCIRTSRATSGCSCRP